MDPAQMKDDSTMQHEADISTKEEIEKRASDMDTGAGFAMPTVFLGNLSTYCVAEDVQYMFEGNKDPIPVQRVDMKRGFCFVYLKDATSHEDKERILKFVDEVNGIQIDKVSKQLRAEFARGDGRVKRKEDIRREKIVPNETLFVVNFHEETTRKEDLEMLFQPYGELIRIDMKRNYAFVQFSTVEQAKAAKEATNGGKLDQSAITVEFVARRMSDDRRPFRDRPRDDYRGRPYRERGGRDSGYDRGPLDYGRRDDRGGRRGGRYDDGPPIRDRRGPFRGDDRYDDRPPPRGPRGGWRDDRSPDRLEYDRRRPSSRSRSRSPPMYRKPRGGRDTYANGRDRDDYRGREMESDRRGGRGGYDRGGGRERGDDREYEEYRRSRGGGVGPAYERGYRSDERGYGGGGRSAEVEGGEGEAR